MAGALLPAPGLGRRRNFAWASVSRSVAGGRSPLPGAWRRLPGALSLGARKKRGVAEEPPLSPSPQAAGWGGKVWGQPGLVRPCPVQTSLGLRAQPPPAARRSAGCPRCHPDSPTLNPDLHRVGSLPTLGHWDLSTGCPKPLPGALPVGPQRSPIQPSVERGELGLRNSSLASVTSRLGHLPGAGGRASCGETGLGAFSDLNSSQAGSEGEQCGRGEGHIGRVSGLRGLRKACLERDSPGGLGAARGRLVQRPRPPQEGGPDTGHRKTRGVRATGPGPGRVGRSGPGAPRPSRVPGAGQSGAPAGPLSAGRRPL